MLRSPLFIPRWCEVITVTLLRPVKTAIDCSFLNHCELSYGSININKCYKTFFSQDCTECHNIWFSRDLVGCSDCGGCINLRMKQYCIFNKQYTKEAYHRKFLG